MAFLSLQTDDFGIPHRYHLDLAETKGAPPERTRPTMARLLFVCSGNTCRSPLAAAMLRAKLGTPPALDDIEVKICP